jgi:fibronectin type 3 domain-containing protein
MKQKTFFILAAMISLILFNLLPHTWAGQAVLSWDLNAEEDLAGYNVYYGTSSSNYTNVANVGLTGTPSAPEHTINNLFEGNTYYFAVSAYDTSGNESVYSNEVSKTIAAIDTTAPTIPSGLTATTISATQINLSWTGSTDSGGSSLAGYKIERCTGTGCSSFTQIATTTQLAYNDTGLSTNTAYTYRIRAYDNAGNHSNYSNTVSASTQTALDTTPPTLPNSLSATTISATQINLSWTASTDSGGSGLAGYKIEHCTGTGCSSFTQIATTTQLAYDDTGLSTNTAYTYRIRAYDNAGNHSNYSNTVSASTAAANLPPTAHAGPDQTVWTNTLVTLDGSASTDPEDATLTYAWTQTIGPSVNLSNTSVVKPTFTPGLAGTYEFILTVSDVVNSSPPDTVLIVANEPANTVPTADAGPDQTVLVGLVVVMDGSKSLDPDGDLLMYLWTQVSGPDVFLQNETSGQPSFKPVVEAAYEFSLVVWDGKASSPTDTVTIIVNGVNSVPTANAGPDQVINTEEIVTLNGSESSDADGDPLTYHWTQTGGSAVTLSDPIGSQPTFIATSSGAFVFSLIVNDGELDSVPDTVNITVNLLNNVPIADAGQDQTGEVDQAVTLDGSGSTDSDGDSLSFIWSQKDGPSVVLSNSSLATPTFLPTVTGIYVFQLAVSDGQSQSFSDSVTVTINGENQVPVANAGPDLIVETGSLVTLDGSMSYDDDMDTLTYHWSQKEGTNILLQGSNSVSSRFFPVDTKTYTFELVVDDGVNQSDPDYVNIYVMDQVITEKMINPESGGVLSISEGNLAGLQLAFPTGALSEETVIGIGLDSSLPPLKGQKFVEVPASFEPAGISFNQPVSVIFPYNVSQHKNPDKLRAYLYDESIGKWVHVPIVSVDLENGLVTANIEHFSSLALTIEDEETASTHKINGGGGCGAITNIHLNGGNPPPWPMDLILLSVLMVWLGLIRNIKRGKFHLNNSLKYIEF